MTTFNNILNEMKVGVQQCILQVLFIYIKNNIDKRQCSIHDKLSVQCECKVKHGKTLMLHKCIRIFFYNNNIQKSKQQQVCFKQTNLTHLLCSTSSHVLGFGMLQGPTLA